MAKRQLVVLSCDALAVTAISAYGSSWNETSQLEQLAVNSVVWDRVITTTDDTCEQLQRIWQWLLKGPASKFTRTELIVAKGEQAVQLVAIAERVGFDQCTVVDTETPDADDLTVPATETASTETGSEEDELETTAIAKLVSAAIERIVDSSSRVASDQDEAQRLIWIHSDLLSRVWDAPHWLFPVEEEEMEGIEAPEDRTEWSLDDFSSDWQGSDDPLAAPENSGAAAGDETQAPPPLYATREVPHLPLPKLRHPDWVLSWMQTYGCQVRLVDRIVTLLLEAIQSSGVEASFVFMGTSGFQLGQNGWIGHRAGPLRSPEIHVPVIVHSGKPGIRIGGVHTLEEVFSKMEAPPLPTSDVQSYVSPEFWALCDGLPQQAVQTQSPRVTRATTTNEWFYVEEPEGARLYSKPDDQSDVNDVAARCRDVIEELTTSQ